MTATPDDSVFCALCDPPYETSIAMWPVHLRDVHGWTDDDLTEIAVAPVIDATDPRDEP